MKRLAFLTATGSAVASVALVASSLAGPTSAVADTIPVKKKPTPTPTQTTPPPPVADGPDCFNAQEAHLFWHRDVRQDGGPGKLNAGEIILAGSFTRPMWVYENDTVFADYGPLGTVTCHFE